MSDRTENEAISAKGLSIAALHNYLTEEGYRPSVDDDGDLRFKSEGRIYFVRLDQDDSTFVRLIAFNVASHLELDWDQALVFVNKVNSNIKVAKAFCIDSDSKPLIWIVSESRYSSTSQFSEFFGQLLGCVRAGVNHLYECHSQDGSQTRPSGELCSSLTTH